MDRQIGTHFLVDYSACHADTLNQPLQLLALLRKVAIDAGTQILHEQSHKFSPQGVTAFLLLSESHISIHTWPEKLFAAVDFFTCGDASKAEKALEKLQLSLGASDKRLTRHARCV